jgi:hypothetical protein
MFFMLSPGLMNGACWLIWNDCSSYFVCAGFANLEYYLVRYVAGTDYLISGRTTKI